MFAAQGRVQRKLRHGEDRHGWRQLQTRQVDAPLCEQKDQANHKDADHGVARGNAFERGLEDKNERPAIVDDDGDQTRNGRMGEIAQSGR